jgi:hypothetical protein
VTKDKEIFCSLILLGIDYIMITPGVLCLKSARTVHSMDQHFYVFVLHEAKKVIVDKTYKEQIYYI